jgi:hypothetical protein
MGKLMAEPTDLVSACPVAGWTAHTAYGMALLTQIDFFPNEQALQSGTVSTVPLLWTPDQMREFAELLLKTADKLTQSPQTDAKQ